MTKCVLCGNDIEDDYCCGNSNGRDYVDVDNCRACREVLKIVDKRGWKKKKVCVITSDYFLPGFEYSKEKRCFMTVKDKN